MNVIQLTKSFKISSSALKLMSNRCRWWRHMTVGLLFLYICNIKFPYYCGRSPVDLETHQTTVIVNCTKIQPRIQPHSDNEDQRPSSLHHQGESSCIGSWQMVIWHASNMFSFDSFVVTLFVYEFLNDNYHQVYRILSEVNIAFLKHTRLDWITRDMTESHETWLNHTRLTESH